MNIAIIGTGRLGAFLAAILCGHPLVEELMVVGRREQMAKNLVLEIASYDPVLVRKISVKQARDCGTADVVVAAFGAARCSGQSGMELAAENVSIHREVLSAVPWRPGMLMITMAAPVDDITAHVVGWGLLPPERIIGFGGDLDRNRLIHVLAEAGHTDPAADVVGEHGDYAIPVFDGEPRLYVEIRNLLRGYLPRLTASGPPFGIAPAMVLAELCDTLITGVGRVHRVCGYHSDYQCHLTWPFWIDGNGIGSPISLNVSGPAAIDLAELVGTRRARFSK